MRRKVTQRLKNGDGKFGRRYLKSKTLAYESCNFLLMLKRVGAGDHTASAMTQKIYRESWFPGSRQRQKGL